MSKTEKFRETHKELIEMVGQLQPLLNPAKLSKESAQARSLLGQFAAKLNMHLAMEDKALYPQLLQHKDPLVQAKAKAFMDQMGGIKDAFTAYMGKYPSAHAIEAAATAFISDTEGLIKVLAKRIQSEDSDLYALVDRLG
jgi:Hemerythrin HHE cation binding domain